MKHAFEEEDENEEEVMGICFFFCFFVFICSFIPFFSSLFCLFFSTQAHTGNASETHGDLNLVTLTMHLPKEQTGIRGAGHPGSVPPPE